MIYNQEQAIQVIEILDIGTFSLIVALIGIVYSMIVIVKQKEAVSIELLGKFNSIKRAGLSFKMPYPFAKVAHRVSLNIQQLKPEVTVKSKDNAFLVIPVNVQYRILDSKIKESIYELDQPQEQISSYVFNKIRGTASSYTMQDLYNINSDSNFSSSIVNDLNEKFLPFGYEIVALLIDDPQPSETLKEAYNNVLAAERGKEAAKNEADTVKIKMVGVAKAEKESLLLKGEAFKEYRAKIASGNREAMAVMLGKGRMELVETKEKGPDIFKFQEIPEKERIETNLTEKDILSFFESIDKQEAIRSVGKEKGNIVVSQDLSKNNSSTDISQLIGLIKSIKV